MNRRGFFGWLGGMAVAAKAKPSPQIQQAAPKSVAISAPSADAAICPGLIVEIDGVRLDGVKDCEFEHERIELPPEGPYRRYAPGPWILRLSGSDLLIGAGIHSIVVRNDADCLFRGTGEMLTSWRYNGPDDRPAWTYEFLLTDASR